MMQDRVANEKEAYERFQNWGFSTNELTFDDILHLMSGGWIVVNNGEYSTGLYLEGFDGHSWNWED